MNEFQENNYRIRTRKRNSSRKKGKGYKQVIYKRKKIGQKIFNQTNNLENET